MCPVLSQHAMIKKIVGNTHGTAKSPAGEIIRDISEEMQQEFLTSNGVDRYRSLTASALYISKRTRPDILLAVNKLCRHGQNPTRGDELKLDRLLKYLSATRDNVLVIQANSLQIEAYIDASWAMEEDRKSTTGAIIMIGGAVIWSKSIRQLIITKSSFEAELVALSDMVSMVLWVSLMMADLGYGNGVPVVYQDNQSTIKVAQKGLSNNTNTKHIDIRYMWVQEVIKQKKIVVKYKKTDEMIADGATKPLTGQQFQNYVRNLNVVQEAYLEKYGYNMN